MILNQKREGSQGQNRFGHHTLRLPSTSESALLVLRFTKMM